MHENKVELPINIREIMKQIPHRYPFLLVDRVVELNPGKSIVGLKNVTINEPFFVGHFEGSPIMPGVLIVEAMAQVAGILSVMSFGARKENELYYFAAINNAKFKRQVIPGDSLLIEVEFVREMRGVSKYIAKAKVEQQVAAESELTIIKRGN